MAEKSSSISVADSKVEIEEVKAPMKIIKKQADRSSFNISEKNESKRLEESFKTQPAASTQSKI